MYKFVLIYVAITFFGLVACELNTTTNFDVNNTDLIHCLQNIIKRLQKIKAQLDITVVNFNAVDEMVAMYQLDGVSIINRDFLWINNTFPNELYVINSNNYFELYNGFKLLERDYYWKPRGKFIIVTENMNNHLQHFSKELIERNIFNVTVVTKVNTNCDIYTFDSQLDTCGKPLNKVLQHLGQCSKLDDGLEIFNIDKPKSLRGCEFKMVSHNYWPFVSFNKTEDSIKGYSQVILRIWNESEGIVTHLKEYSKDEDFGRVLENFTYTGMLHWIEERKVDGAIGGFSITYGRAKALDFSYPYQIDRIKLIVARASLLSNWGAVIAQFTFGATVIFIAYILFFSFAVCYFSIFERTRTDIIRSIVIMFGYLCSNMRTKYIKPDHALRLIVCCLLMFVFFGSFCIQAYLLSATSNPIRSRQIKHLKDVFSTFKPVRSWVWQTTFELQAPLDCTTMTNCLMILRNRKKEKLYTAVSEMSFRTVSWVFTDASGEPELYEIFDPVSILYRAVFFRPGSTVVESYDKLIRRCTSAGLTEKYINDILFADRLKYHNKRIHREKVPESLNSLSGIFIILTTGYLTSFIVFIIEIRSKILELLDYIAVACIEDINMYL